MNVAVVLGTARVGNKSALVAKKVTELIAAAGVTVTEVAVREHVTSAVTVPPWGEGGAAAAPTAWQEIAAAADAFVFVLPEYNHGYPGEWKLLMDSLQHEYANKPAYVVAVSRGSFAGARVMEHVLPVLLNFKLRVSSSRLHVGDVDTLLTETGAFTHATTAERFAEFATAVADGVV